MFIVDKAATASMKHTLPVPKVIFFDIDDTLSRNGVIAAHNQATLEALAKTDIKLVISTGRSKAILPADILALLEADVFDAIICMNAQYSFNKEGIKKWSVTTGDIPAHIVFTRKKLQPIN